jgi:hypothetical protein
MVIGGHCGASIDIDMGGVLSRLFRRAGVVVM